MGGRKGGLAVDGVAWLPGCILASAAASWAFKLSASATVIDIAARGRTTAD